MVRVRMRGHHDIAAEELAVQYRSNQEPSGHVGGFANWGVYTPGMVYAADGAAWTSSSVPSPSAVPPPPPPSAFSTSWSDGGGAAGGSSSLAPPSHPRIGGSPGARACKGADLFTEAPRCGQASSMPEMPNRRSMRCTDWRGRPARCAARVTTPLAARRCSSR